MRYLIILIAICISARGIAQDTHYWTQPVGTRSALMGGAVLASSRDNSAVFYNPALLGWIDTASISINANAYQNETIKIENALGQSADFKSNQIGSLPLLLGGMIRTKSSSLRVSYGIFGQSTFDYKANARLVGSYPLINDAESPGNEGAIAQATLQSKLSEIGGAIGVGKKLGDYFSVGISGLFIVRTLDYSKNSLVRVYMNQSASPLVTSTVIRNVDYYNVRFQPKLGLGFEKNKWQAGLVVSVPSVSLFGNGNIALDATATNIKLPSQSGRIDFVADDRQEKLKTKYKSPFAVGGGLAYKGKRSHYELAVQYFAKVDQYSIINADSAAFARPANSYPELTSDKFLRVLTSAKPVLNVGIAWEYVLKPTVTLYASVRTDQSYFDTLINIQPGIKPDISSWDIYHIAIGTSFTKGRSSICVGLTGAFGKDDHRQQSGNIDNDNESNFFRGTTTITKASYSCFGLLLGYTYNFKRF